MSKQPKPLREGDNWGVGQDADGKIDVVPPDELAKRIAQRNADEAAFAALLDETTEDDDD